MKKCSCCGFPNEDDARFCATCGASLSDEPFTPEVMPKVVINEPEPEKSTSVQNTNQNGIKAKAAAVRDKAVAFEGRRSIILNTIVAVCALIIALVVLLAPIKTVAYISVSGREGLDNMIVEEETETEAVYSYVEIKQSLWQMIGALGYISADENKQKEIATEVATAYVAASVEYATWALAHPDADETVVSNIRAEIISEHLSDANYFGYLLAMEGEVEEDAEIKIPLSADYWAAVLSLGFGLIVTLLAFITAIISLVYFIKAIVGMAKNKPQPSLYKYLGIMLGISCSGLCCMFAAPMLAAGGGMFAVAVFSAIVYIVCGFIGALAFGHEGLVVVVKRLLVAIIAAVAFFILCSNILSFDTVEAMDGGESYAVSTHGYAGYGLFRALSVLDIFMSGEEPNMLTVYNVSASIIGLAFYLIIVMFAVPFAGAAMRKSIRKLAFGDKVKSMGGALMIAAALSLLITIVSSITATDKLLAMLIEMFEGEVIEGYTVQWTMLAPMWASMIMFVVSALAALIYNPKRKEQDA